MDALIYDIKDVSSLLNVGHKVIRRAIRVGQIEVYKIGRDYRFTEQQVSDYLSQRKISYKKGKQLNKIYESITNTSYTSSSRLCRAWGLGCTKG